MSQRALSVGKGLAGRRTSKQRAWEDSFLMTDDTRYYEFSSFMHRESESN